MRRILKTLIFTPLLIISTPTFALIPQIERDALSALYLATAGDSWHNNSGWNELNSNECNWFGVSCDVTESTVTGLQLNANNLRGPLPASIINLSNLNSLKLDYNAVYSDKLSVNDFINGRSQLDYRASQTLDATGISFSSITASSLQISWQPVSYLNDEGGYRVFLAEQVDSETGSFTTDFLKLTEDVIGKTNTTITLTDLSPCRQYFVKVVSYTNSHAANNSQVESDGIGGPIVGTIAGFETSCTIIGSPYDDTFSLSQTTTDLPPVIINVSDTGERHYRLSSIDFFHIDGNTGQDSLTVLYSDNNTWTLSGNNSGDVNGNTFNSIEILIGQSSSDTLIGLNTANDWAITGTNTGTLNNSLSFTGIENLVGGSGIDTFTVYAEIDGAISGSTININSETDVIVPGTIGGDMLNITGDSIVLGSLDISGNITIDANINTVSATPQLSSTTCDSTNNVTLSSENFTTLSPSCYVLSNPVSLAGAFPVDGYTLELSTEPPSQEAIDNLLTMDGWELPTDDGNTCTITDGQCIAEDGSIYVFSDGKLVKEETGTGSLDKISLLLIILYFALLTNRKKKAA